MEKRISLNGVWHFRESNASEWYEGEVPGCVQLDLIRLGKIEDPYYRMNEIKFHKLEEKEWVYKKEFDFNAKDKNEYDAIKLVFEGIDTFADIYLNGIHLGKVQNMFIPYEFDIKDIVKDGNNVLEVHFDSITKTIKAMEQTSPVKLEWSGESGRPYVRKAQYSYGWDWGPRIVQVGLWRGAYLSLVKYAEIKNPYFYTEKIEQNKAYVVISAEIEGYIVQDFEAEIEIIHNDISYGKKRVKVQKNRIKTTMLIENPKLWYPNGIGEQPLYDIRIRLLTGEEIIDEKSFRSGIRTVKLVREKDEEGETFIFEINGIKVFAKGVNWIPADNLLPRLTKEDYYEYIRLAKDANMNMLRIWGGGIYEDPAFYDACDEMGIMVWQDFMYACAEYPDQFEWFQKLAKEEAEKVILSLRNHPSIVLWCGNNENNWGFHSWWDNGDPKYLGNYIYKEILPKVCAKLDPSRPYWVSSPYGGEDPNSETEGDRHQWNVWSGWVDYEEYTKDKGRFLSEFGFQSMPDWKTVLSYTSPEDRTILSPVMISHNKMVEGMERLVRFMVGHLGFPKDLKSFVYLSQFNQAEAIKTGVEHWRSRKFKTAGTLYWQFNDCWPVASWSCIDYYKRKKALYHYSKKFYAEILPYIKEEDGGITVYGISDLVHDKEVEVTIKVFKLNGEKIAEKQLKTRLIANDVTKIAHYKIEELNIGYSVKEMPIAIPGCTLPVEKNGELLDSVIYVEIIADGKTYENYKVFDKFRNLSLIEPKINYQIKNDLIVLTTDVPAFGVFIEPENDIDLSDNCLNMMPGKQYEVKFSQKPESVEVFDITQLVANI
ncbi:MULTISPECIES: beta-mannosidase [Thermoanaerobacter]|uniref:Beta-mannosidase n=2 Tax=Thermoanaerobacter TaxID=1754 RepID=B0KCV2_THEP3|nr:MULTISPECIES: sugar-binding domain-containing protein [Thermoanaerobacter]ABY95559.1 glycoside hydrolase family 2, sugar binding [Thermoanaerobacter pseudethanolicus ATCC 33223]ADV80494.1 glycoside hydrolase family 2 sugar binding protein [Thermoanaerobacter brockii subsp. finnii Ako-1]HBW60352.1 glycoside hydrolase family 2 [Thermoanaerobacter sp.]